MQSLSRKQYSAFLLLAILSLFLLKGESLSSWPREVTTENGKITLFQPEIESLSNDTIECRSAVIFEMKNDTTQLFGAIWYKSLISTDRDERTVTLLNIQVLANKFPNVEEAEVQKINAYIVKELPQWELTLSLDDILTSLKLGEQGGKNSEKLKNDPPEIIFTTAPTALILVNGEPIYQKIDNTDLEYVINSPFFILRDTQANLFYLKGGETWYSSSGFYVGWEIVKNVPQKLLALESSSDNKTITTEGSSETRPTQIFVRTHPTELLVSNGTPQYASVENTSLLYMTNTDDDILMDINTQEYYTLISGRWYKSQNLSSNRWRFVSPDSLPTDFSKIPEKSPVSDVRASVAGTQESKEAVLETKIPQTATIDRTSATVDVVYDGDPSFRRIKGTKMLYAINTEKAVLWIDGVYYCCDNGVWFKSNQAKGPWMVATSVPSEVMTIPPEYPIYNVKYVVIFDYTPQTVRVGYFPGYEYSYVYRGCVYYGTGYSYYPWYGHYYYARPITYGYGVHYNSYYGWGFSFGSYYDGYDWIDQDRRYHHNHRGAWGPRGYRHTPYRPETSGPHRGYQKQKPRIPRPDLLIAGSKTDKVITNNLYSRGNKGVTQSGNRKFDPRTGQQKQDRFFTKKQIQPSNRSNDLFLDRSNSVYKHQNNGTWEPQENKKSRIQLDLSPREKYEKDKKNQSETWKRENFRTNENNNNPQEKERRSQIGRDLNVQLNSRERSKERSQTFETKKEQYPYSTPKKGSIGKKSEKDDKDR